MTDEPLLRRVRSLWVELAGAPVGFRAGAVDVVVSPRSLLCPPGWCGVVEIGDGSIATAPDEEAAAALRRVLSTGDPLRDLPSHRVLGPASLAYCDAERFRPAGSGGELVGPAGRGAGLVGPAGEPVGLPGGGDELVGAGGGLVGNGGALLQPADEDGNGGALLQPADEDGNGGALLQPADEDGNGGVLLQPADDDGESSRSGDRDEVEAVSAGHPAVTALRAGVSVEEDGEAGLEDITSAAFVVRGKAVAGYELWPQGTAHLSVLTAVAWRGRGWGRRVASAATADALANGLLPQWRARPEASRRVARALGFAELGKQVSIRL
ncbi:GNAT family N-acetyltransferase [Paractinoplanes lichenicola]|uniref:GNAT family N-acetyltransferase n=1 Tax=Paractinoplanes lichenicola TaxID=2802976 RepID=A0ABS1VHP7_9ACTN|nr:GNAT family N-acetyltransferase [Actinoplanes lichenicola]MBL7253815.1 GNAT family N-acetyltransferase [Actinoplanes lichenicola]